jgi:hypothetical protein
VRQSEGGAVLKRDKEDAGELGLLTMHGEGQSVLFDDVRIPMWLKRSMGRTGQMGLSPEGLPP